MHMHACQKRTKRLLYMKKLLTYLFFSLLFEIQLFYESIRFSLIEK